MEIKKVTSDNFKEEVLNSKVKVLIDFYADWCGPCRMLRPVIDNIANKRDDVKIVSINVDDNEELARKYGVMSIPCLVLIENGQEIRRSVGLIPEEDVIKLIEG